MELVVYSITNLLNNKIYIGKSVKNVKWRWNQHKRDSLGHSKLCIHRSIRKHGIEFFRFEVIDQAINAQELCRLEQYHIYLSNSTNPLVGYNRCKGGSGGYTYGMLGKTTSEETKKKQRDCRMPDSGWKPHPNSIKALKELGKQKKGKKTGISAVNLKALKESNSVKVRDDSGTVYESVSEASKKLNIQKTNISAVLTGKRKKAGGKRWYYVH